MSDERGDSEGIAMKECGLLSRKTSMAAAVLGGKEATLRCTLPSVDRARKHDFKENAWAASLELCRDCKTMREAPPLLQLSKRYSHGFRRMSFS